VGGLIALFVWAAAESVIASSEILIDPSLRAQRTEFFDVFEASERYGHKKRPNLHDVKLMWGDVLYRFTTDELGFENSEDDYREARLAFVGDSFVDLPSLARQSRFYALAAERLGVKAVAYGVGNYGMLHYRLLAEDRVIPGPARVSVICIFANDLSRPLSSFLDIPYSRRELQKRWPAFWQRTLSYGLYRRFFPPPTASAEGREARKDLVLFRERGADPAYFQHPEKCPEVERLLGETIELLIRAKRRCLVLLIPSKESTYLTDYERLFPDGRAYMDVEREGYARLARIAREHGAVVTDLTPAFRQHGSDGELLYYRRDNHWNARGNEIAAQSVVGPLRSLLDLGS
jgi:hypothetical protein